MAEIIGRQVEVGIAAEAVRGTAEATADRWLRKTTATVVERATHAVDETTFGRFEDGVGRRVVQKYIEGEISGPVHADAIGYIFGNIYGLAVSSLVSGSVYEHVYNLKQTSQHASLTIFAKDGTVQQQVYSNCMVNTLQLAVALEGYITFTASFIGSAATSNADTPDDSVEYDFVARDVTIKMAATEGGLAGATAVKAKGLEVNWDQGIIRDHVVGSYTPDDNYNSRLMIEGNFTLNYDDNTFKTLYLGDTPRYMLITIEGEADLGGGEHPKIEILLNKVQLTDWNREGEGSDLVTQPVQFRAFYNQTDQKQSQVTLQNLTASYANIPSS